MLHMYWCVNLEAGEGTGGMRRHAVTIYYDGILLFMQDSDPRRSSMVPGTSIVIILGRTVH